VTREARLKIVLVLVIENAEFEDEKAEDFKFLAA
jgi:hypothetical protein